MVIATSSEPEAEVCEVQSAEQDEALDDDQVKVVVLSNKTEVGFADKLTVGAGVVGVAGSLPPPPPPPPPQETTNKILKVIIERSLLFNFI